MTDDSQKWVEAPEEQSTGFFRSIRNRFFTGVIIALPIAVTIWLISWFITVVDDQVLSLLPDEWNPNIWIKKHDGT